MKTILASRSRLIYSIRTASLCDHPERITAYREVWKPRWFRVIWLTRNFLIGRSNRNSSDPEAVLHTIRLAFPAKQHNRVIRLVQSSKESPRWHSAVEPIPSSSSILPHKCDTRHRRARCPRIKLSAVLGLLGLPGCTLCLTNSFFPQQESPPRLFGTLIRRFPCHISLFDAVRLQSSLRCSSLSCHCCQHWIGSWNAFSMPRCRCLLRLVGPFPPPLRSGLPRITANSQSASK